MQPPKDRERQGNGQPPPLRNVNLWYLLAAVLLLFLFQSWWIAQQQTLELDYSEFRQHLVEGRVERVQISENYIVGELRQPLEEGGPTRFNTTRVDPDFADELEQYDVVYDGRVEDTFLPNLLAWLLPISLLILFWWFIIRRMAQGGGMGGLMSIGKSKAKIFVEKDTKTTFDDVAGVDEAKRELRETVDFLKDPKRYGRLGARQPKGILLVGPPGTGKTLLARAVAGEAGVPFFSISGSEFVEMFVGVGAARVRDLFEQAKQQAPCIIFIDELDALGRARGGGGPQPGGGGHDEKEQTLNQLLNEMDGFDPRTEIVVLAATNQPQVLDQALLRAGRFDRQVLVDRPDRRGRLAILKVHVKKITLAPDVDLEEVARLTAGFSGADLENLVNEAAIIATRRDAEAVTLADFTSAVERIVAGLEKRSRLLSDPERRVIAHHEMGHAIVAQVLPGVDPVHKVSIIPRGIGALGYTMQRPTEDRYLLGEDDLDHRMIILLGGRAAEELVFGRITTGAADDIAKATDIARQLVTQYGMEKALGPIAYEEARRGFLAEQLGPQRRYAEETAREIDSAIRARVQGALARARDILERNRRVLERASERLLAEETLEGAALEEALAEARLPERQALLSA
jgi:cell division protease FtsH